MSVGITREEYEEDMDELARLEEIVSAVQDIYFAGKWIRPGYSAAQDVEYWNKLKALTGWSVTGGKM